MSKLQKTSAIKRKHPALQNMKFHNIFLFLWVIFASWSRIRIPNTDPDTLTWIGSSPDPKPWLQVYFSCKNWTFTSKSRDPIESGSNPDNRLQHWFIYFCFVHQVSDPRSTWACPCPAWGRPPRPSQWSRWRAAWSWSWPSTERSPPSHSSAPILMPPHSSCSTGQWMNGYCSRVADPWIRTSWLTDPDPAILVSDLRDGD